MDDPCAPGEPGGRRQPILVLADAGQAGHVVAGQLPVEHGHDLDAGQRGDAADTAFLSTYGGAVTLTRFEIMAVLDGELPGDDVTRLASIG